MAILPAQPNVAIVGATGAVGREMLAILEERSFPHGMIRLLASERSAGVTLPYCGTALPVEVLSGESFKDIDLALFSAGGSISTEYAPRAVAAGAVVVDNSSAFRMDAEVPLVTPEVNPEALDGFTGPGIIANPNCTTMVVLMAVTPLHRAAGVKSMVVSTYQAASGAGAAMMAELEQQARDWAAGRPLTTEVAGRQYLFNVFSHDSAIGEEGYNAEEWKLLRETRRLWGDDDVTVSATCVRVPVLRAHCASVRVVLDRPMDPAEATALIGAADGVRIVDDPAANRFPEPIDASGLDDVLVGRIRRDLTRPGGDGLMLFTAGDQLRKGAALNAIQIAELLLG